MSDRCIIDCAISLAALWIIWRGAKSLWRDLTEPPPPDPYLSSSWTEQAAGDGTTDD